MRLGQLTRQLEVEAKTIIKFLAKEGIEIENHPNTKLAEKDTELVLEKFKKEVIPEEEPEVQPIPVSEEVVEEEIESPVIEEEIISETISTPEEETTILEEETKLEVNEEKEAETTSTEDVKVEEPIKATTDVVPEMNSEEGIPEVKVLDEDTVNELVEQGEIQSDIEAEAAKTEEAGIIKAKLTKLEGLNVVGKIELPSDPRREKKEAARKEQELLIDEQKRRLKKLKKYLSRKRKKLDKKLRKKLKEN